MALSRASRLWPADVLMTPASTTTTPPGRASRTPKPVAMSPGSTPMTRRAWPASGLGGGDSGDDFVGDVVVGVDGLDVVLLLDGLDQAQNRGGVLALDAHEGLGHHVDLRFQNRDTVPLQRLAHRLDLIR